MGRRGRPGPRGRGDDHLLDRQGSRPPGPRHRRSGWPRQTASCPARPRGGPSRRGRRASRRSGRRANPRSGPTGQLAPGRSRRRRPRRRGGRTAPAARAEPSRASAGGGDASGPSAGSPSPTRGSVPDEDDAERNPAGKPRLASASATVAPSASGPTAAVWPASGDGRPASPVSIVTSKTDGIGDAANGVAAVPVPVEITPVAVAMAVDPSGPVAFADASGLLGSGPTSENPSAGDWPTPLPRIFS